jgi:ubiquinone/menaquinone biosynthesis C-methylase UbiE
VRAQDSNSVQAYYDQTYVDYRLVWANGSNYAMHFGYYQPGIRRHAQALENANSVLAGLAQIAPGEQVLDAGCGVGGTSRWLARMGAQVVGITPVASQVRKARQLASEQGIEGVRFEQGDYTATPFADASFDAAVALESLCHADDKAAFYREMFRVLRPGGRLVVAEYVRNEVLLDPAQGRLLDSWLSGWAIPNLGTGREHLAWAQAAGFSDAQLRDGSRYTRRSLRRLYRLTHVARPIDFMLHRVLGWRTETQSGNVRASRDQWRSFREGHWFYGIVTARKG